jgi:NADH-quinone oxidoreductase subunit J
MLTHKLYDLDLKSEVTQFLPSAIICGGLFVLLAWPIEISFYLPPFGNVRILGTLWQTSWATGAGRPAGPTTEEIGRLFMSTYLLPFEAASVLLLVALMGAAMIVRRRKDA